MATLTVNSSFAFQTVSPVAVDWTTVTGTYIQTALSTSDFTEEAYFQGTFVFPADVTVQSVGFDISGQLSAGGISSASFYINSGLAGSISSNFGFTGTMSPTRWSLVGRSLTIAINVACSPYTGTAPTLLVFNPTFTVTYEPLPVLHNLGINF